MSKIMRKELERLERRLLHLSALVQENIKKAVKAFETRDIRMAEEVRIGDSEIDQLEVDIEEECLKLLALYQPVAIDLRFVIATLKINNDLERVGDLANNIAKHTAAMAENEKVQIPFDFSGFARETINMLECVIDAFTQLDLEKARQVLGLDKEIDRKHRQAEEIISRVIREDPEHDIPYLQILWVSRCLERIGDHATNIAEDIVYLLEGDIIRHQEKLGIKKKQNPLSDISEA